ncbi:NTP transferase domain-containing protein [Saccharibacter sp. 17.LH.SD]|uniref:nucleotidyltransferase family protein n=1 Tax=Saccharibacter sp. 17.LH.SD TaxID=2689393 RepID=UPI0013701807|nr:nucleotidyltransferase family protein [Saccharibacter sp. 17.LH.SD]MXV44476.1 NTP transferase domain-containing protein [Saccharibacter sp. 17.LH.SD]
MTLPVLILAGSRDGERDPLARAGRVSHKAVLPIHGVPMIERVVHALETVPSLGPIWVSIEKPDCLAFLGSRIRIIPAASSPSESVSKALETIGTPCLITTADHALLHPEWISEFLEASNASDVDLTAAIASSAVIERDVPQTQRTYIRLADLSFSGCNLFFLRSNNAQNVVAFWRVLQKNRKHPVRMAFTFGLGTLVRFLFRRLRKCDVEARIHTLTGARVALIPLSDGRAAVDVDKISDLKLVQSLLAAH